MSTPLAAIFLLWTAWVLSWVAAAFWSAQSAGRPAFGSQLIYRALTAAGVIMLFYNPSLEAPRFSWPVSEEVRWVMVGLTATGLLFSWWARIHLGSLWSSSVEKKQSHHVVDTGPYRLVRHPIYTGIILACYATAIAKGTLLATAGASVMVIGWYVKARMEEHFLREQLGKDAYGAYAARVPMLVPFVRV